MRIRHLCACLMATLALTSVPRTASADWLLTPFAGVSFGGDIDDPKASFGASFAYMGAGIVGFEVDLGVTPEYADLDVWDVELSDASLTTLMANVIVGIPVGGTTGGGIRPYFSGGGGLMRTSVKTIGGFFDDINSNDFGINVGGGVMGFFNDRIGIRGDIRYFRALRDEDFDDDIDLGDIRDLVLGDFEFWRATGGVVIRF